MSKKTTLIGGAAAASALAALLSVFPDLRRYLRIRRM
ncbi:DUF6893 family small protein [Streptomyces sp. SCSIO 30461]